MPSFGFIPLMVSVLRKIDPFCSPDKQSNSPIWTKVVRNVEDYSINISVKKIEISRMRQKTSWISSFPIISLLELEVAIATRVIIQLEQKHNFSFPLPIDAICEI